MHELAVCQGLISEVERVAALNGASEVTRVSVLIGPLSGVEIDLLERAFPIARAGSVAAQAELAVETGDIRVQCTSCGAQGPAAPNKLICGNCGDWRVRVVAGDELLLKSVELSRAAAPAN